MKMKQLSSILAKWQLTDPVLYRIASTHSFEPNCQVSCPVRTGKGRLEYNVNLLKGYAVSEIERLVKIEMVRIALHHPYERRPDFCSGSLMTLASNMVICDNYPEFTDMLPSPSLYELPVGKSYEWYALNLYTMFKNQQDTAALDDASELWDEDGGGEPAEDLKIQDSWLWGNEEGIENIWIKTKATDARKLIARLRSLISYSDSSERRFTRMRPNRRRDYEVMGMIRKNSPRILIAFDVSTSMHQRELDKCLGVIASIGKVFRTNTDILFFDNKIRSIVPLKTALSEIVVPGGGGTDFNPAIQYALKNHYEVLVYLTDGKADIPHIPYKYRSRVLWCSMYERQDFMDPKSYFNI